MSRTLKKRPININRPEDIRPEEMEKIFRYYDESLSKLDERRINKIDLISEDATLADVISKINELLSLLNSID